ncbi:flavin reductase family protein [Rhodobium gokarnense]|uniref:Flavin reductase n=1 Tax=Rhodobium gokarnense TaxID=364296 RepID=A0ABT3HF76_9HYPH|nr:flavin reductase family protein [Rhodobium gokarnense]MCW2309042.1 flavin reductase [Rhodobium gokarnense]
MPTEPDAEQIIMCADIAGLGASGSNIVNAVSMRPARRPAVDEQRFRDAMAASAASVGVVAATLGDERQGRTVTAALSLSLTPPTILVSIDARSTFADFVTESGGFSYSVLSEDQGIIGQAFASRIDQERRFELGAWQQWPSGQQKLVDAVTALDCEVIAAIATVSHILFIGAVIGAETCGDRRPLLWHDRQYTRVGDHIGAPQGAG